MRLFGTVTSPYVRRVRIVADELGLRYELVDVFTEAGQAAMRALNPTWKVPALELEGQVILDSRVITEHLLRIHGPGPLTPHDPADRVTSNLRTTIDGALDALINSFYLARDGITREQASYLDKQHERAASAFGWLEDQVDEAWPGGGKGFGLAEIGLCTTIGWMRFRETYPIERHPKLLRLAEHHGTRGSVVATAPPSSS